MQIIKGFKDGWRNAVKFHKITGKYDKKCKELDKELIDNGLTKENWEKFRFGGDISGYGMGYAVSGFFFFITHSEISRVGI